MPNSSQALPLLAAALCFMALLGLAHCHQDRFFVQGRVYCDTCRAMFETRVSEYMAGARVRLECRGREAGNLTYSIDGASDETGTYRLLVEGDHEDDICEVRALESSIPDCDELAAGRQSARVALTGNNGVVSDTRLANSLGFLKKETLPVCPQVLREMGLLPGVNVH